jgi:hypothetical protein
MLRLQNGQIQSIKKADICFESVAKFEYLETTATNETHVHEASKRRLNFGNACYHSVPNVLSSSLLSGNVKD